MNVEVIGFTMSLNDGQEANYQRRYDDRSQRSLQDHLVVSRFRAAPYIHLSSDMFKNQWAFPT